MAERVADEQANAKGYGRIWIAAAFFVVFQLVTIAATRDTVSIVWFELPVLALLCWLARRATIRMELPLCVCAAIAFHLAEPSVGMGPIIWVALLPMFELIRREPRKLRLTAWGLFTGVLIAVGIYAWTWSAFVTFFDVGLISALPMFLLVCVAIGIQFAVFLPLARVVYDRSRVPFYLAAPLVYVAIENWMPLPLPVALGLAFAEQPTLLQPADVAGLHGISLLVALVNGGSWQALQYWRERDIRQMLMPAVVALVVLSLHCGYGLWARQYFRPTVDSRGIDIAMIQPVSPLRVMNTDTALQEESASVLRELSLKACCTTEARPDLLLWPEGAGAFASRTPQFNSPYMRTVTSIQAETSVPLVVQDIEFTREPGGKLRYYSTISVIEPVGKSVASYRKNVLMPFGEYLPFETYVPILRKWMPQARSVLPGMEAAAVRSSAGTFAPSICFETLYPRHIAKVASSDAGYIVNLTNDRWYGKRQQPRQHLTFAQLRAIENRRPVARATNSGISALIDARGFIERNNKTRTMERTVLRGVIHPRTGYTLYVLAGQYVFPILITSAVIGAMLLVRRRIA